MIKIIFIVLGVIYLNFEFLFNVNLLDLVSSNPMAPSFADSMHWLELSGKILSSFGLFLLVGKLIAENSFQWVKDRFIHVYGLLLAVSLLFVLIASGVFMFWAQERVAEYVADNSTPKERKAAVAISISTNDIREGRVEIAGFGFSRQDFMTPEGKTFIALIPYYAISNQNADVIFTEYAKAALKIRVDDASRSAWERYVQEGKKVREKYNQYAAFDPEPIWNEYVRLMTSKNMSIYDEYSSKVRMYIINTLRKKGVMVKDDWQLDDKAGFIQAIGHPGDIKSGLSWNQFVASSSVQTRMREEIGKSAKNIDIGSEPINLDMNYKAFSKRFMQVVDASGKAKLPMVLAADVSAFADGGEFAGIGRDAVKRVKIPVISLGFSGFFATFNLLVLITSFVAIGMSGWKKFVPTGILLAAIIYVPLHSSNNISKSEVFKAVIAREGEYSGYFTHWVTNAEPMVYAGVRTVYPVGG